MSVATLFGYVLLKASLACNRANKERKT